MCWENMQLGIDDGLSYGHHNDSNKQINIGVGANSCAIDLI